MIASQFTKFLGKRGILISDACSVSIVSYVADKLWYETQFPYSTWVIVLTFWILASIGTVIWPKSAKRSLDTAKIQALLQIVNVCLCALVVKFSANLVSWRQAGAFGFALGALLCVTHLLFRLLARMKAIDDWDGLRFGVAQWGALFAVHPYVRSGILGAGDASSYSSAVADFLEQRHSGIFPILIGQSRFAFNGGFQPIRNAPYLQHLAWALDSLCLGTVNEFALLNLTVFVSMLGGVLSCYAALRISTNRGTWLSLGLAILFGLCPGILAPLYGGDMYPTFMTLPFLPWLVLGIKRSADAPNLNWPWLIQGTALAAIWLCHPPIAAWATLIVAASALAALFRYRTMAVISGTFLALAVFSPLSCYVFVSVASLNLPRVPRIDELASVGYKLAALRNNWAGSFLPISPNGDRLLTDLQLGYGIWACLLITAASSAKTASGRSLLGCFALILLFAWPIPVLTDWAWRSLPTDLLVVTNQWPNERFYILLAALSVFIVAPPLSSFACGGRHQKEAVFALLSLACLWSVYETSKFFRRAKAISTSEIGSKAQHLPENITLSRTHSYEYLGTPAYFSNGHMDPRLETRLLDSENRSVIADGSTYLDGAAPAHSEMRALALQKCSEGVFSASLKIEPNQARVLRFDFWV